MPAQAVILLIRLIIPAPKLLPRLPALTARCPAGYAPKQKLLRLFALTANIILIVLLIHASLIRRERLVLLVTADRLIITVAIPARQALRLFILRLIIARPDIPVRTQAGFAPIQQEELPANFQRLL